MEVEVSPEGQWRLNAQQPWQSILDPLTQQGSQAWPHTCPAAALGALQSLRAVCMTPVCSIRFMLALVQQNVDAWLHVPMPAPCSLRRNTCLCQPVVTSSLTQLAHESTAIPLAALQPGVSHSQPIQAMRLLHQPLMEVPSPQCRAQPGQSSLSALLQNAAPASQPLLAGHPSHDLTEDGEESESFGAELRKAAQAYASVSSPPVGGKRKAEVRRLHAGHHLCQILGAHPAVSRAVCLLSFLLICQHACI